MGRAGLDVPRTWNDALDAAITLRRHGLWAALPAIPVDAICTYLAVCCALGEEPFVGDGRVVSDDVGCAALDVVASFVSRCHPASTEWNPPRMLEHMATEPDVAYCPLAFGYSNYARPGFRRHVVRFAGPPAGKGVAGGTLGGAGLAISTHSSSAEEAARFAAFVAAEC